MLKNRHSVTFFNNSLKYIVMSISDWFQKTKEQESKQSDNAKFAKKIIPDGVWVKCEDCGKAIYQKELVRNLMVCPLCSFHFQLAADQRIELIADDGTFSETEAGLLSSDPLKFNKYKPYKNSLKNSIKKTGLNEAIKTGLCEIGGIKVALGVMDFRFIGGSMGSVVGEKVARLVELCITEEIPLIIFTASGGARMQEGMYSLMQMAKTCAVIAHLKQKGLPYISVLTNPTTGGVTASFSMLADIVLAEPKALIGFAGPRVIQQTIGQRLPKGFQSAEFLLERGFIDKVIPRNDIKETTLNLLHYLMRSK